MGSSGVRLGFRGSIGHGKEEAVGVTVLGIGHTEVGRKVRQVHPPKHKLPTLPGPPFAMAWEREGPGV